MLTGTMETVVLWRVHMAASCELQCSPGKYTDLSARPQVANGLRVYFDKALPQMLLYPQEQEQCKKVGASLLDSHARVSPHRQEATPACEAAEGVHALP